MAISNEKKKILVVDDNEAQLISVRLMLEEEYNVTTFGSGKEALDHLVKGYFPNLILLDILMPHMDGWETFNRLKAISFLKEVPIVFVTSLDGVSEKERAFEIGAADYILKPLVKSDMLNKIKNIIDKSK